MLNLLDIQSLFWSYLIWAGFCLILLALFIDIAMVSEGK